MKGSSGLTNFMMVVCGARIRSFLVKCSDTKGFYNQHEVPVAKTRAENWNSGPPVERLHKISLSFWVEGSLKP